MLISSIKAPTSLYIISRKISNDRVDGVRNQRFIDTYATLVVLRHNHRIGK